MELDPEDLQDQIQQVLDSDPSLSFNEAYKRVLEFVSGTDFTDAHAPLEAPSGSHEHYEDDVINIYGTVPSDVDMHTGDFSFNAAAAAIEEQENADADFLEAKLLSLGVDESFIKAAYVGQDVKVPAARLSILRQLDAQLEAQRQLEAAELSLPDRLQGHANTLNVWRRQKRVPSSKQEILEADETRGLLSKLEGLFPAHGRVTEFARLFFTYMENNGNGWTREESKQFKRVFDAPQVPMQPTALVPVTALHAPAVHLTDTAAVSEIHVERTLPDSLLPFETLIDLYKEGDLHEETVLAQHDISKLRHLVNMKSVIDQLNMTDQQQLVQYVGKTREEVVADIGRIADMVTEQSEIKVERDNELLLPHGRRGSRHPRWSRLRHRVGSPDIVEFPRRPRAISPFTSRRVAPLLRVRA
jgi:hypothetical protein